MQTVNIKIHTEGCEPLINSQGDWIDLRSAENITINPPQYNVHTNKIEFQSGLISLGVTIQAPKGYEVQVLPRSSTFKKYGIVMSNSMGIVDYSYRGENDIIHFPYIGMKEAVINKGDRIAQFRIVPSQFKEGVQLNIVDKLEEESRGGFGSTGWQ